MELKTLKKIIPLLAIMLIFPQATSSLSVTNAAQQIKTRTQDLRDYSKAKTQENKLRILVRLGGHMIDRRITALNRAKLLIDNSKKIDPSTKDSLISIIDDNINNLTSLKTKIENSTNQDLADLKSQVRSIISNFHIYISLLPKMHGLVAADRIDFYLNKLTELNNKINDKLPLLGNTDTTEIKSLISQANDKIAAAETNLDNARNHLNGIQSSDTDSALNLKKQARQELSTARKNANEAKQLLRQAIVKIKQTAKSATVQGTGYLYAKGNGTITINGNGTVNGIADKGGTAVVTDSAGDVQINTNGQGNKEDLGNNQTRYTGFGTISVTGTNFNIKITGSALEITAQGTGTASMTGSGSYKTSKDGELKTIPTNGLNLSL